MSVCKVHHRPGCSLAPCSRILYNQSKVTCQKLHAERVEVSRHSKNFATNVNTQTYQCTNHPERTNPSSVTQAQTQKIPFGPKSKLPRPIKRSSGSTHTFQKKLPGPIKSSPGSTHTFPLSFGSPMGEGKHPNKPTCVIKASRTAAAFSRFSELKQTFASLENLFVPQQQALCVTSPSSASDVTSLVETHVQLSSASHSLVPVLASAQLSTELSSLDPTTAHDSTRDSAAVSIESQSEVFFDADPSFTPSHCRHLNHNLFYLSVYKAPQKALHSLGLAPQP